MASLKEVKGRINSIHGTLKITSAMKMVASSKLHKAQEAIENMLPYERRLHRMLSNFLGAELSVESPFAVKREVKKVAVVVFASNSSLCGGFNANVIRHLNEVVAEYEPKVGRENILIYPVGRKVADAVKKMEGLTAAGDYQHMSGKPNYQEAADLAAELMTRFSTAVRLILIPALVWIGCLLFHIDTLVMGISVVLAAMPAASTTAILAAKYGGDEVFATKCVVFTTLLSMVSAPVWCMVLQR